MYYPSHFSSVFKTFINAIDNAARCNCYVDSNMIKEPVYVLIEGSDDRKFVRVPIESTIDIRHTKNDTQYIRFDKNPMFPVCMDSYYRGVSPDLSMNLREPTSPSMSSLRAKAKLQEAKDFRKAMDYVRDNIDLTDDVCIYDKDSYKNINNVRHENTSKNRLDSVDLDSNCDGENIFDLLEDPSNEDAINNLTYEEEQLLLHLMSDSEIKTITKLIEEPSKKEKKIVSDLIEEPTKKDNKIISDQIEEPIKEEDENIFDLLEDPSNEDAINNLTYEEELQLLHLMEDSERKIITDLIKDSERKIDTDLTQNTSNEDDSTTLTYDEELQLLHLMADSERNKVTDIIKEPTNEDDKIVTDLIEVPTNEDDEIVIDLIEELTNEDDKIVTDLIEEPNNEEDNSSLTYEEELQLLHLMDDSGKIVWERNDVEEEFKSVVVTNVESLQSINEKDFKNIDESLINQCYLILENAPPTDDICI